MLNLNTKRQDGNNESRPTSKRRKAGNEVEYQKGESPFQAGFEKNGLTPVRMLLDIVTLQVLQYLDTVDATARGA